MYWRAGRDSRYSVARRGIGTSGGIGAARRCWGYWGHYGGIRGVRGIKGCRGVRGVFGWQMDWKSNDIGSQLRVPAFPLVPLGRDLPGQGQASDRNELCRLLYTFETTFHDSFHICIDTTSSHILTCNIKKCYMDYFLCKPIYKYPYAMNLTYYDTMVLIMKNYFSHHISELGTSYCKCQADMM